MDEITEELSPTVKKLQELTKKMLELHHEFEETHKLYLIEIKASRDLTQRRKPKIRD
jgi:hypothetical protein